MSIFADRTGRFNPSSVLWYAQPARCWEEALPVGNGQLGAMVYGRQPNERFQLNENTLWSGGPMDSDNAQALPALAEIRRLLFAGQYAEAQSLTDRTQICQESKVGSFGCCPLCPGNGPAAVSAACARGGASSLI